MRPQDLKLGDTVTWDNGRRKVGKVQSIYGMMVNVKTEDRVHTVHISKIKKRKVMLTEAQKIARIASLMAVSNLGHLHNINLGRVTDFSRFKPADNARYDVCTVAGHLIESDDHEDMFSEEAESWEQRFREAGFEAFVNQYSHHEEMLRKVWNS